MHRCTKKAHSHTAQQVLVVKTTEDHRNKLRELQNYRPNVRPLVLRNDHREAKNHIPQDSDTIDHNSASRSLFLAAIILISYRDWGGGLCYVKVLCKASQLCQKPPQ